MTNSAGVAGSIFGLASLIAAPWIAGPVQAVCLYLQPYCRSNPPSGRIRARRASAVCGGLRSPRIDEPEGRPPGRQHRKMPAQALQLQCHSARKALSATAPVSEQFIEQQLRQGRVGPAQRKPVGQPRISLHQAVRSRGGGQPPGPRDTAVRQDPVLRALGNTRPRPTTAAGLGRLPQNLPRRGALRCRCRKWRCRQFGEAFEQIEHGSLSVHSERNQKFGLPGAALSRIADGRLQLRRLREVLRTDDDSRRCAAKPTAARCGALPAIRARLSKAGGACAVQAVETHG